MSKQIKFSYKIYDDSEIVRGSKIGISKIDKDTAYIYRDLMVHRFGATGAEVDFALTINGMIFAIVGIRSYHAFTMWKNYVHLTYTISMQSKRYPLINRLMTHIVTSTIFRDKILHTANYHILDIEGIKTTGFSQIPKIRALHGLMSKVHCKEMPNKTYKMQYYTSFWQRTKKQILLLWLDEVKKYDLQNKDEDIE
jgi:hypothetical protein